MEPSSDGIMCDGWGLLAVLIIDGIPEGVVIFVDHLDLGSV